MNLPNFLTIFRILALPVCAWALFKNGGDDSTWRILTWSLFTIVILVREFSVTFLRFAVIKREIISASRGGKLKTLIQGFAVGFYILPIPHFLYFPRDLLLGVAVFLTISTGLDYFKSALKKSAPLR